MKLAKPSHTAFHYNFISGHIFVINNLIYVLSFPGDKSDEFNQLEQVYVRAEKIGSEAVVVSNGSTLSFPCCIRI